jgi:hypothetical protein
MVGMGEPAPVTSAYLHALAEKLVKEAAWPWPFGRHSKQ